MLPASRPPVRGNAARQLNEWIDSLVKAAAAELLIEDPENEREALLARASIARHIHLRARDEEKRYADLAYEHGASNTAIANALGVAPQTTSPRYPDKRPKGTRITSGTAGYAGWRKQKVRGNAGNTDD